VTDAAPSDQAAAPSDQAAAPSDQPTSAIRPSSGRAAGAPGIRPAELVTGEAAIRLDDVVAGYGDAIALDHLTIAVPQGSLLAVVGPNGAGKSTMLKLIAGLLPVASGRVEVLGARPGVEARRIAYVPQAELVDWDFPVTVEDVVMMGRFAAIGVGRRPGRDDHERVEAALETVAMRAFRGRQVGRLSGGQRRRVFLARALAAEPDLYLLDEPVTGVDATTQEDLMDVLEAEARAGKTVVATTHDLLCAAQRFHQAALLNRRLVAHGPAALVLDQALLSATYGGHVLVLPGETGAAVVIDDAHHHDQAPGGERHYHDGV
jgi:ABC-type Mn2+/Zn2+ transport system ATPase subunit